ncbi:MAG: sigma-70 family RNA polymerase sigma factor [Archangiaceae bacterium]|nr:sigma-70 family RNA polymerase sigma factor [Archangiaceae bacterium]
MRNLALDAVKAGEAQFPMVRVDVDAFARFLALQGRAERTQAWPELFLAFACGQGDAAALEHFEKKYLAVVRPALRHLDSSGNLTDEIRQQLRVRFFVGPPARILDYVGLGSLEGWVRAAAVRLALDLQRRATAEKNHALDERIAPQSPELQTLKAQHGPAFRSAFDQAFNSISSRERAVLKLHLCERASIDQIAALYGIHRATAARWIQRINQALRERTMMALTNALNGATTEAQSLVKHLVSGLDVSIRRQLAASTP